MYARYLKYYGKLCTMLGFEQKAGHRARVRRRLEIGYDFGMNTYLFLFPKEKSYTLGARRQCGEHSNKMRVCEREDRPVS